MEQIHIVLCILTDKTIPSWNYTINNDNSFRSKYVIMILYSHNMHTCMEFQNEGY